jgi:hypothetical protein
VKEISHFEDVSVDGIIVLKWILKKPVARMCTTLIRFRIGTSGRLLLKG